MQQAALASHTYQEPPAIRPQYVTGDVFPASLTCLFSGRRRTRHVVSLPNRTPAASELARRVEALTVAAEEEVRQMFDSERPP